MLKHLKKMQLTEAEREAALALVPEAGLSNRELGSVFDSLPFDLWQLTFSEFSQFMALLQGEDEPAVNAQDIDIIALLAPPPTSIQSAEPSVLYSTGVYDRGALTLHALRLQVGDELFFNILRTYIDRFGGGSASSADFVALAQEVSGQDLTEFFTAWLEEPTLPDIPELGLLKESYR